MEQRNKLLKEEEAFWADVNGYENNIVNFEEQIG